MLLNIHKRWTDTTNHLLKTVSLTEGVGGNSSLAVDILNFPLQGAGQNLHNLSSLKCYSPSETPAAVGEAVTPNSDN